MNITLRKKIKVEKYKAILDIGQKMERSDIIAILKIAQSHNDSLSEDIICKEFIFRDNKTMAKRVLKICKDFDVIDNDFKITDDGYQALKDNMVYHSLTGTYYIWISTDPLIPQKILCIEPIIEKSSLKDEIKGFKVERDEDGNKIKVEIENRELISTPDWLRDLEVLNNIVLFDSVKTEIRIQNIEEKMEVLEEQTDLIAEISVNSDAETKITLYGLFEDTRELLIFPDFKFVWTSILGANAIDWDWKNNALAVNFEPLNEDERINLTMTLKIPSMEIGDYGPFNKFTIPSIAIKPKSRTDAVNWGNWLLINNITRYIFDKDYKELIQEIQSKFPDFKIKFYDRNRIANELSSLLEKDDVPDKYWYINAPLDLIPMENTEDN